MASFLTPLIVKKIGAQLWELYEPLVFYSDMYSGSLIAPKGMVTNFASIPRFLWVQYPPVDIYDPCATIHDGAYQNSLLTATGLKIHAIKAVADNLFYEALIAVGVHKSQAIAMYNAVRLFGKPKMI